MDFIPRNRNKPAIYISTGSSGKSIIPKIVHNTCLLDFNLIVSGGDREYESENAIFRNFVNFDEIADEVDLVICHGGNGTVYQALNYGKRIITVPYIFEQEWNVQRFSELDLCKVFYPGEKPEKLIRMIKQSLAEPPDTTYKGSWDKIPDNLREKWRILPVTPASEN